MSGPIRLYLVDAFTDLAFSGNPAAVCLLDSPRGDRWRQSLAAEMCVSETAYLERIAAGRYGLRWFTPTVEVELCGHATLASAHALWREEGEQAAALCFETRSGKLSARRVGDSIELDLPAEPARPAGEAPELLAALGVREAPLLRNRMDFLLELESEAAVRAVSPDFPRLRSATRPGRGVIVTARAEGGSRADFVSRYFAPAAGIDEDPVTGAAHCALGPYWAERLGRNPMKARQISARGGSLEVFVDGNRVRLSGRAVTVLRGELAGEAGGK
jgi:PhzF family phenazine biosynthesis protein